jgi:hypothetical protein
MDGEEDRQVKSKINRMRRYLTCTRYHWALLIGPKVEKRSSQGRFAHVKNTTTPDGTWTFEEAETPLTTTRQMLVRVLVAKVADRERLLRVIRAVPIVQKDTSFNCIAWVRHALEALQQDKVALGTSSLDWTTVRDNAMAYCQKKKDMHRFDGKVECDITWPPTFDLLAGRETRV